LVASSVMPAFRRRWWAKALFASAILWFLPVSGSRLPVSLASINSFFTPSLLQPLCATIWQIDNQHGASVIPRSAHFHLVLDRLLPPQLIELWPLLKVWHFSPLFQNVSSGSEPVRFLYSFHCVINNIPQQLISYPSTHHSSSIILSRRLLYLKSDGTGRLS